MDLPGVFLLRWMDDSFAVHKWLTEQKPKSAIIVGGGYIGMEMADALSLRGLSVTVVEFADTVLTTVDKSLGEKLQQNWGDTGEHSHRSGNRID